jgi:predicted nucleotidyltransferase
MIEMGEQSVDTEDLSVAIGQALSQRKDIISAYLFGSLVNGYETAKSDADIAVLFSGKVPKIQQLGLQQELSDCLKREVDLVDLAQAPVVLRMQVLRKGRKLFDRGLSVTTSLIVRTLFEYDDLKRIIKPIEDNILRGRIYG